MLKFSTTVKVVEKIENREEKMYDGTICSLYKVAFCGSFVMGVIEDGGKDLSGTIIKSDDAYIHFLPKEKIYSKTCIFIKTISEFVREEDFFPDIVVEATFIGKLPSSMYNDNYKVKPKTNARGTYLDTKMLFKDYNGLVYWMPCLVHDELIDILLSKEEGQIIRGKSILRLNRRRIGFEIKIIDIQED